MLVNRAISATNKVFNLPVASATQPILKALTFDRRKKEGKKKDDVTLSSRYFWNARTFTQAADNGPVL